MRRVAALYVDPRGPYPRMRDVDAWDESRDAKRYAGPHPVVAHPPCGPWSRMRGLSTRQDKTCAPRAVEQVRAFGGVLEHPELSRLWPACGLPVPEGLPDHVGGRTYAVRQVSWGHICDKPTWLYVVGVAPELVVAGLRTGGVATHRVTSGPGCDSRPSASKLRARLSPEAFAEWLVSIAREVGNDQ